VGEDAPGDREPDALVSEAEDPPEVRGEVVERRLRAVWSGA
jgi:hypothetical protein